MLKIGIGRGIMWNVQKEKKGRINQGLGLVGIPKNDIESSNGTGAS